MQLRISNIWKWGYRYSSWKWGSLKVLGMPKLENVVLVNGLKVNLISISQLCDDNLLVQFTKGSCSVTNSPNSCVMEGKRSSDNCSLLTFSRTYCTTLMNNSYIWHKRLGHISPRSLNEAIVANDVRGILKLKVDLGKMCGPCQLGKQVKLGIWVEPDGLARIGPIFWRAEP